MTKYKNQILYNMGGYEIVDGLYCN